jgi:Protein of unknown function (Hypoth_ymh)
VVLKPQYAAASRVVSSKLTNRGAAPTWPLPLRSISEQSEQRGAMHLMKGIFAVFRNPTAHELKARWAVDERAALDLLTMVSVVHRRLDSPVRVTRGGAR